MVKEERWKYSSYIIILYIFVMFCIYPFYYENGYYNMGTAKCRFFLMVSAAAVLGLFITVMSDVIRQKESVNIVERLKKISITEKWLYVYMVCILLSYILSDFKESVLWGDTEWCMGTIPLLLIGLLSVVIIHIWVEQEWLEVALFIVSAVIFLLGICNRFSVYPIPLEPKVPEFISMLGNINWFCGYMSVISPIGIGLFIFKEYEHKWQKWALSLYLWIVFITGFCQGSSSVFLWNVALFFVLFWILVKNTSGMKKWLLTVAMWGMSGQIVRILKILFEERYNYDSSLFVDTNVTFMIALTALFFYAVLNYGYKEEREWSVTIYRRIRRIVLAVFLIGMLSVVVLGIYNTKVGIPYLEGNSLFLFDENWGNERGAIFKVTFELWERMSPIQKLFGVGADGFSVFSYSIPEIHSYLQSYFGNITLTNAHCEILTSLINVGIVGTVAYISIFVTFVIRCMKQAETHPLAYIPVICVICYFANNLISFAQVLNFPYLFLILGMGECFLKNKKGNDRQCS